MMSRGHVLFSGLSDAESQGWASLSTEGISCASSCGGQCLSAPKLVMLSPRQGAREGKTNLILSRV